MAIDLNAERKHFETAIYARYHVAAMRALLEGRIADNEVIDRGRYLALKPDGAYKDQRVETMWGAWQMRAELDMSGQFFGNLQDVSNDLVTAMQEKEFPADPDNPEAVSTQSRVFKVCMTLHGMVQAIQAQAGHAG